MIIHRIPAAVRVEVYPAREPDRIPAGEPPQRGRIVPRLHEDQPGLGIRAASRLTLPSVRCGGERRSDGRPVCRIRRGGEAVPILVQQIPRIAEGVEEIEPALRPRMVANQAVRAPGVRPGDLVRGGVHLRYQSVAVVQVIDGLRADGFGHPPAEGVVGVAHVS